MLARVASTCSVTKMEELKKETKNSTTKANLFEDENRRMEKENMALKKVNTAIKEEIRMMKEENRRIEEEKLVEKKLNKGMKVEIDTKKEETRLTNPERQMKHENRLSLFLTDSHGKIIDFQKIEEELGGTLVRGKAYNSATWPFSKFPEKI